MDRRWTPWSSSGKRSLSPKSNVDRNRSPDLVSIIDHRQLTNPFQPSLVSLLGHLLRCQRLLNLGEILLSLR